jgi:rRNA maturation endonuclease Nob1
MSSPIFHGTLIARSIQMPVELTWQCRYCDTINPSKNVHCEHCGAPRKEQSWIDGT